MILRTISLQIGEFGLSPKYKYAFKLASRYVCNYVERNLLKELKFRTDGFDRIVIDLCLKPAAKTEINDFGAACVEIDFPQDQIDSLTGAELTKLQIAFLKNGLEQCALAHAIPKNEIFRELDHFVEQGMKNEWLHKKKTFKAQRIVASLFCVMTQDAFTLRLTVSHFESAVFDGVILETGPDEHLFAHKFRDVVIEGENLVVTEKNGRPLWTKPLQDFQHLQ